MLLYSYIIPLMITIKDLQFKTNFTFDVVFFKKWDFKDRIKFKKSH